MISEESTGLKLLCATSDNDDRRDMTTELDLSHSGITDMENLLENLENLTSLRVLHLSNNQLTRIPSDLSYALPALEYLDLSGNPISVDDLEDSLLRGLASLPKLKHLTVTLESEEDEDNVVVSLTQLESFNGTPLIDHTEMNDDNDNDDDDDDDDGIEASVNVSNAAEENNGSSSSDRGEGDTPLLFFERRDGDKKKKEEEEEDNESTTQKNDFYFRKAGTQELVQKYEQYMDYHMRKLQKMEEDEEQRAEEVARKAIFSSSDNHNDPLRGETSRRPGNKAFDGKQEHNGNSQVDKKDVDDEMNNNGDEDDDHFTGDLMSHFSNMQSLFQEVRYFTRLSHSTSLFSPSSSTSLNPVNSKDVRKDQNLPLQAFPGDFGQFLKHHMEAQLKSSQMRDEGLGLSITDLSRLACRLMDPIMTELTVDMEKMDRRMVDILSMVHQNYNILVQQLLVSLQKSNSRNRTLRADVTAADGEISKLLDASLILEKELERGDEARKKLAEQYEAEKEQLANEIGWLSVSVEKERNKWRQYDTLRRTDPVNTALRPTTDSQPSRNNSPLRNNNITTAPSSPATSAGMYFSPSPSSGKQLTHKQAKDLIEEIHASKTKFDARCAESRLPRETMEQHLYTYLTQKYGLKQIILEHASALIQAIKRYGSMDNDMVVFGKILRNEIDEEFRFVQRQLKETVLELLRVYLKGKHPLKVDANIQNMLQKRVDGMLQEEEWVDIIKYMYNREDSVMVITRVKRTIAATSVNMVLHQSGSGFASSGSGGGRGGSGGANSSGNRIPYQDFVQVLLDFQLRRHERFLRRFVSLFKNQDHDRNGILDELQFRKLLLLVNDQRTEEDIDALLEAVDPFNNQHITFSECVSLLSGELVQMMASSSTPSPPDESTSSAPNTVLSQQRRQQQQYVQADSSATTTSPSPPSASSTVTDMPSPMHADK